MLQTLLAQSDLLLQHGHIFLQLRIGIILADFLEQYAHGRQRRRQLVRRSSRNTGNAQQLRVARALLPTLGKALGVLTQGIGHAYHKQADQPGAHGKVQPHTDHMQVDQPAAQRNFERGQWLIPHQQRAIGGNRYYGQHRSEEPRQGCRGDGQRHQVIGYEGVGRATREIQQHAVHDHIEQELQRVLETGHGPTKAQAQQGQDTDQRRDAQRRQQRRPGQRKPAAEIRCQHRHALRQ